jgi:hypothetical protein
MANHDGSIFVRRHPLSGGIYLVPHLTHSIPPCIAPLWLCPKVPRSGCHIEESINCTKCGATSNNQLSIAILDQVFPFFTYVPSSGMLGDQLPKVPLTSASPQILFRASHATIKCALSGLVGG